ncbi:hypothetical protein [Paraclostridium sordellii]|uniref:hypothetical protein n=1 Tax=Paraclostridium sordellii TaxID=1505 RepID=UPI0005E9D7F7|nr:hypothetical protein [Paeniclostridium sordellii]CEN21472.1 Uncharacterised protein [[Clostridium] sordellii] [Paeniclostridium sordellii]
MYNSLVSTCFGELDIECIFRRVCILLNVPIEKFNRNVVNRDTFQAFGMHQEGECTLNTWFTASVLNNILLNDILADKQERFVKYFLEAVLVHEIHHAYMYFFEKDEYFRIKRLEFQYKEDPLEIEADNFMLKYMDKYHNKSGEKIAEISKTYRSEPSGDTRTEKIKNLIKEYLEVID